MGKVYADVSDITALGRNLTAEEQEKAPALLENASGMLRRDFKRYGHDLDAELEEDEDLLYTVKTVLVKAVLRALDSSADTTPPAVQASQAALGYSVSMTYLNSGQALYFLKNELKELGLLRQHCGVLEVYDCGSYQGNNGTS